MHFSYLYKTTCEKMLNSPSQNKYQFLVFASICFFYFFASICFFYSAVLLHQSGHSNAIKKGGTCNTATYVSCVKHYIILNKNQPWLCLLQFYLQDSMSIILFASAGGKFSLNFSAHLSTLCIACSIEQPLVQPDTGRLIHDSKESENLPGAFVSTFSSRGPEVPLLATGQTYDQLQEQ